MGFNCVVCVKQVPDTKRITGQAMKDDGTVNRAALPAIFNPEDLNALELALQIRDLYGGRVDVVTMGLPKACNVLRDALFLGADRGVLITDRRAAGSDTLATSYILACAIRENLKPDIVLCGRQAIDGDTAQVGPQLAEKLDFTLLTYVEEVLEIRDRRLKARRNLGNGYEIVAAGLPVLMTVIEAHTTEPRPAAARRVMKYKKALCVTEIEQKVQEEMAGKDEQAILAEKARRCREYAENSLLIEQWNLDNFKIDLDWCGLKGSPTKVNRVQSIVLAGGAYKEYAPTDEGIAALVSELVKEQTAG